MNSGGSSDFTQTHSFTLKATARPPANPLFYTKGEKKNKARVSDSPQKVSTLCLMIHAFFRGYTHIYAF